MAHQMLCLSFLVTLLVAMQGIHAVEYVVINTAWNTPGGVRFNNQIGSDYSQLVLSSATNFIWRLFQENCDAERKNVTKLCLFTDVIDGAAYAITNEIHVSAR